MPKNEPPSATSSLASPSPDPLAASPDGVVTLPEQIDVVKFRQTDEGRALVKWALDEFTRCKTAKAQKQRQWYINLSMVYGHQWIDTLGKALPDSVAGKLVPQLAPKYYQKDRRTINRLRAFVRSEQSKFLSTLPTVEAVPATAEDEDGRSAKAAEQVWESYASRRRLRREYSKSLYWMVNAGSGFLKTWWDPTTFDRYSGQPGDIVYRNVTPFHIFVPDLREVEVDDQPYIQHVQVKNLQWAKTFWAKELEDAKIAPSTIAANSLLDDAYLNLQQSPRTDLDSVVIYEVWVKPNMVPLMPDGGFMVIVEDILVAISKDGLPYKHGEFCFTKFDHLSGDTFFADSPLIDLIPLQREYNDYRTEISVSGKRVARPFFAAQKGSIDPSKWTNEPGQILMYNQGFQPPTPMQAPQVPEWYLRQSENILMDFEDISGQHAVSRGDAPPGVTAGTAISFLQEKDDQFLTPQYQNVEDGFERIAIQTLALFQEFVDVPRQIKTIGLDSAYDLEMLSGADIAGGTDIRVEPGSAIGQSMAAKRATIMEMFSVGMLPDPNMALHMMEVGGAQKILDVMSAAEKKAQRENIKMKRLQEADITANANEYIGKVLSEMIPQTGGPPYDPTDPMAPQPTDVLAALGQQDPEMANQIQAMVPPVVQVDDFDIHAMHIDTHNRFRMTPEYEILPDAVKKQFEMHVQIHTEMAGQQAMTNQMLMASQQAPPPGGSMGGEEQGGPPPGMEGA